MFLFYNITLTISDFMFYLVALCLVVLVMMYDVCCVFCCFDDFYHLAKEQQPKICLLANTGKYTAKLIIVSNKN